MTIDIDRLREDLKCELLGAYFGGGFGGALIEASGLNQMTPEQIVELAQQNGIDLRRYIV